MKPVFKCDYCSHMGTKDEIREHEEKCYENYDRKSCFTCKFRGKINMENHLVKYDCEKGKDIPSGKIFEFCDLYERKEKTHNTLSNIFGDFFGIK